MHLLVSSLLVGVAATTIICKPTLAADDCAPGAKCVPVSVTGQPAQLVAQCSGAFPDFISPAAIVPASGPTFKLSQGYPANTSKDDAP